MGESYVNVVDRDGSSEEILRPLKENIEFVLNISSPLDLSCLVPTKP